MKKTITILVLLITFGARSSDAQQYGVLNGRIAFVSDRDGNYEIYVMDYDGNHVERLTFELESDRDPAWSPDGEHIAFASMRNATFNIYVMNDDGSNQVNLTNNSANSDRYPAWSPDGTKIAFSRITGVQGADIYIMNADGSELRKVVDGQGEIYNLMPTWSPDGTQLIFSATANLPVWETLSAFTLYKVNVDGSGQTELGVVEPYGNPDWSWVRDEIVYYGVDIYDLLILKMDNDGSNKTQITHEQENVNRADTDPRWSPDGTKIVFSSIIYNPSSPANFDIYVADADGTNLVNLTENSDANDITPTWQPILNSATENGPIAFVSKRDGNFEIYKMDADGDNETRLTNYSGQDWSPAWSPDGSLIAFMSTRHHASGEIYTMNPDGSSVTRLTTNTYLDTEPDWSPDGSKIVFVSARTGSDDELWVMDADGDNQVMLYDSAGDDNLPSWSPDGTKIAFSSNQSGNWDIWVINATDGSGAQNLTNHVKMERSPAWSQDGSQIAFVSDRSGYDVYAMPATGGTATNISNNSAYDSDPTFSPDNALLAFISKRDGDNEVWTMLANGGTPHTRLNTDNAAIEWDPDWTALVEESLLGRPAGELEAGPDTAAQAPETLNVLPAGFYEESYPDIFYGGRWRDEAVKRASDGSVRFTRDLDGIIEFLFEGQGVTLYFASRPDTLPIDVCVDEVCQEVDLYSTDVTWNVSVTIGGLVSGEHRVVIRNASPGYLYFDAVEVVAANK